MAMKILEKFGAKVELQIIFKVTEQDLKLH